MEEVVKKIVTLIPSDVLTYKNSHLFVNGRPFESTDPDESQDWIVGIENNQLVTKFKGSNTSISKWKPQEISGFYVDSFIKQDYSNDPVNENGCVMSPDAYGIPQSKFCKRNKTGSIGKMFYPTVPMGNVFPPITTVDIDVSDVDNDIGDMPGVDMEESQLPKFPINLEDPDSLKKLSTDHLKALVLKAYRFIKHKSSNEESILQAKKNIVILSKELVKRKSTLNAPSNNIENI
jgi:hypothetical protein